MENKTKQKLEAFFDGLDCDLEIGLAYCLAEQVGVSAAEVFSAYGNWQIADSHDSETADTLEAMEDYSTATAQTPRAIETETYTLPSYWASYLINGDASGLEDSEKQDCDDFLSTIPGWICSDCSEESFFSHRNDAGTLAGDCLEYTFFC